MHRSRLCHFVIDVPDLDQGVWFWSAALNATEESLPEQSRPVYRRLRLPDSQIRILLQKTGDEKTSKERMHLDLEADDVEAEVRRLEALGATRWDHQAERGFDFWVLRDPWGNEFCVLQPQPRRDCRGRARRRGCGCRVGILGFPGRREHAVLAQGGWLGGVLTATVGRLQPVTTVASAAGIWLAKGRQRFSPGCTGRAGLSASPVEVAQVGQYCHDAAADLAFPGQPEFGEDGVDVFLDRGF